jgi:NAD(P)-dependent dehydrogenase (short-subunit alcohol dehydrogenase family)
MNRFDLAEKSALITGAGGLLGREHAFALAEVGANLILTDVLGDSLISLKTDIVKNFKNSQVRIFSMDVTKEDSIRKVLKDVNEVHILINNAAIDPKVTKEKGSSLESSRLENFDIDSWNLQLSVGLTGAMLCAKVFGTEMAKRKSGVILNIASDLSVIAPDQRIYQKESFKSDEQPVKPVTYSVIKHGLVGLTKYLATYWADQGVRVNSISPGGVFNNHPDDFVEKLTSLIPLGRMANKDEYRGSIQFLCSNASSYMTGQNLVVDGGRSCW